MTLPPLSRSASSTSVAFSAASASRTNCESRHLALPATAPWMKIAEAVEYLRAVNPQRAVPIHQGILKEAAYPLFYTRFREMGHADFQVLPHEDAVEF